MFLITSSGSLFLLSKTSGTGMGTPAFARLQPGAINEKEVLNMANEYQTALEKARRELSQKNTVDMARASGVALSFYPPLSWREFTVPFLGRAYQITWPSGEVFLYSNRKQAAEGVALILLHYLIKSSGKPPTGKWIPFKYLQEGSNYYPAFSKRALKPLSDFYSAREKLFAPLVQQQLHARQWKEKGTHLIMALPRLPILIKLGKDNREIPSGADLMFDETANEYLSTEDLASLGEALTGRLLLWGRKALE